MGTKLLNTNKFLDYFKKIVVLSILIILMTITSSCSAERTSDYKYNLIISDSSKIAFNNSSMMFSDGDKLFVFSDSLKIYSVKNWKLKFNKSLGKINSFECFNETFYLVNDSALVIYDNKFNIQKKILHDGSFYDNQIKRGDKLYLFGIHTCEIDLRSGKFKRLKLNDSCSITCANSVSDYLILGSSSGKIFLINDNFQISSESQEIFRPIKMVSKIGSGCLGMITNNILYFEDDKLSKPKIIKEAGILFACLLDDCTILKANRSGEIVLMDSKTKVIQTLSLHKDMQKYIIDEQKSLLICISASGEVFSVNINKIKI